MSVSVLLPKFLKPNILTGGPKMQVLISTALHIAANNKTATDERAIWFGMLSNMGILQEQVSRLKTVTHTSFEPIRAMLVALILST